MNTTPNTTTDTTSSTGPSYITDKRALLIRLHKIEGQVRGLERMVDADAYCIDILTQVSAATRALESVALSLLDAHLRHCVAGRGPLRRCGRPAQGGRGSGSDRATRALLTFWRRSRTSTDPDAAR